jgi:hypothetical protein
MIFEYLASWLFLNPASRVSPFLIFDTKGVAQGGGLSPSSFWSLLLIEICLHLTQFTIPVEFKYFNSGWI